MYQIEKNVTPTKTIAWRTTITIYPFKNMEIGDSFSFPKEKLATVRAASCSYGRRHNVKFSVASKDLRVWRIA